MTLDLEAAAILDTLPCGVCVLDGEWRFTYVNPKAGQLFEQHWRRPPQQLIGKSIWEEFPGAADGATSDQLRRAVAEQRAVEFEAFHPGPGRWFAYHAWPCGDRVCVVFHDVSERKRLEGKLRERDEASADAERGRHEFLAELAHELRNALAPIRNALHLMEGPGEGAAPLEQARDLAEQQVRHVSRLIDDLLNVSQLTRGKVQPRKGPIDLRTVVTGSLGAALEAIKLRGGTLVLDLPAERLGVEGDPALLGEVTARLLDNAVKFTEPGGQIRLAAEAEGDAVVLRVQDNGAGIAPEMLPRVFDLFLWPRGAPDRPRGGLGTGLALVRGLVELHGGSVEARSAGPGLGSEFVVRLPGLPTESRDGAAVPSPGGRPLRVLVVDDNAETAQSMSLMLGLWGHEVRVTYEGEMALDEARREPPEVVLLDIGMPGLDGYEVARRLRGQEGGGAPVLIALTGYGEEEDRRRAREAGFEYHLVKPVEPDELRKMLALAESLVRQPRRPAG